MNALRIATLSLLSLAAQAAPEAPPTAAAQVADKAVYRVWTDNQGRKLEATFRGIEGNNIYLQIKSGFVHALPLDKLSAEDQKVAASLKPEGLGIPVDPNLAQAATKIDFLVEAGLKYRKQTPNPLASDEQFVRRVYLDIVG
ncbi:MAG: SHD1 domain-containing protein, partial [Verrucomicrobiaceae bacterium]